MHLLSNFTSLLEATFGLNLAFGLFQQIHHAGLLRYNQHKADFFQSQRKKITVGEPRITEHHGKALLQRIQDFEDKWESENAKHIANSESIIKYSSRWALVAAVISLLSLIYCAIDPNFELNWYYITAIIVLLVLPPIVVMAWLSFYWNVYKLHQLESEEAVLDQGLDHARDIVSKVLEHSEHDKAAG